MAMFKIEGQVQQELECCSEQELWKEDVQGWLEEKS